MNFLKSLLLKLSGQFSKTKVTAVVGFVLALLQNYGVINLTPEQLTTAAAAIVTLIVIFFRSGVDEAADK